MTFDPQTTIVLSGLGRSGTTWVSEIINYRQEFRYIFEPLHPEHGIPLRTAMHNERYLPPELHDAALRAAFEALLAGVFENAHSDAYNSVAGNDQRLIKFIRLNRALKWVQVQFPGLRLVTVLRHPGAVVHSQMRQKWGSGDHLLNYVLAQDALLTDHLAPFLDEMRAATNEFERRVLLWCTTVYMLLRQFRPGEMHWVLYETLVTDPITEARRMLDDLGIPVDEARLSPVIDRPSPTAWDARLHNPLASWQDAFTRSQKAYLMRMLRRFGLNDLYSDAILPDAAALAQMLAADDQPRPGTRRWGWLRR